MIYEYDNSISYLKNILLEKSQANPQYSLRSFAKKLNLSPATLSSIFNHKRKLSLERAIEIAERLELKPREQEYFITLVQYEGVKKMTLKLQYLERLKKLNPKLSIKNEHDIKNSFLDIECFKLISSWHGLAILEYVSHQAKKIDPQQLAKKMGISKLDVEVTLNNLLNLGLIEMTSTQQYRRKKSEILVEASNPVQAMRSYYKEIHQKSLNSVESQNSNEKVIGAQVFAFDPDQIDAVRELTDQYLNQLNEIAKAGKKKTEIYQALANVFRLTHKEYQ